ncbi:MAG: KTSC domain-containing protein [Aureispira sp.]
MLRNSIISSSIAGIGYDPNQLTLEVEFLEGIIYRYFDIPASVYLNLVNARSRGRFFNYYIKPFYRYNREN